MENKKEPLMSVNEYFIKVFDDNRETSFTEQYANYHTQWHLNNAKEFVADEAGTETYFSFVVVDKQSIHTAIDNYIEINLNKEL